MTAAEQSLRAAVFLGLSVDGRIARPDGDLEWLTSRGDAAGDAGFTPFMESVDVVVMGRKSYEAIASEAHWPEVVAWAPLVLLAFLLGVVPVIVVDLAAGASLIMEAAGR